MQWKAAIGEADFAFRCCRCYLNHTVALEW